jgi:hypothetical protein
MWFGFCIYLPLVWYDTFIFTGLTDLNPENGIAVLASLLVIESLQNVKTSVNFWELARDRGSRH